MIAVRKHSRTARLVGTRFHSLTAVACTAALLGGSLLYGAGSATAAPSPASVQNKEWWIGALGLQIDAKDAGGAWQITKGAGVTIAVLDEGVDSSVGDLRGALVKGFSTSGSASPTTEHDDEAHGTAMAVHIVGRGTSPGILGVAPQAKVMPVYVAGDPAQDTAAGLNRLSAMATPPAIVNMSYGQSGACPAQLQSAVARAVNKGMILVASAGNTGDSLNESQYPSNCKGVVAAGAFDPEGKPWQSTQRQPYVSIGGPGVQIESYGKNRVPGPGGYGTSFASAIVSGELALMRAHWPTMSGRQLVAKLFATVSSLYHGPGYGSKNDVLGYGIGVVNRALRTSVPSSAPNAVYDDLAKISSPSSSPSSSAPATTGSSQPASSAPATVGASFPGGTDSASSDSGSSGHTGLIIGIVVAAVLVLGIGAAVLMGRRRSVARRY